MKHLSKAFIASSFLVYLSSAAAWVDELHIQIANQSNSFINTAITHNVGNSDQISQAKGLAHEKIAPHAVTPSKTYSLLNATKFHSAFTVNVSKRTKEGYLNVGSFYYYLSDTPRWNCFYNKWDRYSSTYECIGTSNKDAIMIPQMTKDGNGMHVVVKVH